MPGVLQHPAQAVYGRANNKPTIRQNGERGN
jgi:hypothetical protein